MRSLLCIILATTALVPTCADAQSASDLVIMRRPIAPPNRQSPQPGSTSTPAPTASPVTAAWLDREEDWGWAPGASTCSEVAQQVRTVQCRRGTQVVADAECTGRKPIETRGTARFSGCTYRWTTGEYGAASPVCSATGTKSRGVSCMRSDETVMADQRLCSDSGEMPAGSMPAAYEGCTYYWKTSPTPSCANNIAQNVQCIRSNNGGPVAETFCASNGAGQRPADFAANSEACELVQNGQMDSSDGYYAVTNTVFSGGVSTYTGRSQPNQALVAQEFDVVDGKLYRAVVTLRGTANSAACTASTESPFAIWKLGVSRPVNNFFYEKASICPGQTYQVDRTFRADYTGRAQIIIWAQGPNSTTSASFTADDLSVKRIIE